MRKSKKTQARNRIIAELDKMARALCFDRDHDTCQRCGETTIALLQWSHVLSRRHYCIRWEPDNSKVLCMSCHCYWTNHPIEAAYWFSKKWPLRWEHVHELLRTGKPMKDANLKELLEEIKADPPATPYLKYQSIPKDSEIPF